jgi:REP element-mobilizing transposase RayT
MVKPLKLCIMPDHIHGLLFVKQDIGYHLGRIIWGFKVGTNQAARLLGLLPVPYTAELPQSTGQRHPKESYATTVCCGKQATTTAYYKEKTSWKE